MYICIRWWPFNYSFSSPSPINRKLFKVNAISMHTLFPRFKCSFIWFFLIMAMATESRFTINKKQYRILYYMTFTNNEMKLVTTTTKKSIRTLSYNQREKKNGNKNGNRNKDDTQKLCTIVEKYILKQYARYYTSWKVQKATLKIKNTKQANKTTTKNNLQY